MQYLEGLNERQKEAVLCIDGPVSVLAGAGSGKTKVLTTRIYHLIRGGVLPSEILAVTFTNKAAREMRERVSTMLGYHNTSPYNPNLPFVATFHGLGRELLEKYGSSIGIPKNFTIYDRDDSERAVKEALKLMGIDPKNVPPRMILSRISKAKGEGLTSATYKERHGNESFESGVAGSVWTHYNEILAKEKSLDFDDLIVLPVHLLSTNEEARKLVQDRFKYVHIDEYQDTNELQGKLADLLTGERRNLFVVGDIDQTIYTWRGATIENLLKFDEAYPNAKTIILDQNYRSTKTIVSAANEIIEKNKNRKEKYSTTSNPEGETITVRASNTGDDEALWVAGKAKQLIDLGVRPEDIAVLFRTNFQSRALEEGFLRLGVPYKLLGTRFFDRKEVKDVLAWIRLALDPTREVDRIRAVQAPSRGIGKVLLGKMVAGQRDQLKPAEQKKVEAFEETINALHQKATVEKPSVFVKAIIEQTGLEKSLQEDGAEGEERLENIRELATLATRYDEGQGLEAINAFLADAALAGDQDELDRKDTSGVTLMTVHASKGLEFDTVFVTGMEEGLFPHEGMDDGEKRDEEEERRLFYVAITRARKKVFLTLAAVRKIYGTDYLQEPSNFIDDISRSLVTISDEQVGERIIHI